MTNRASAISVSGGSASLPALEKTLADRQRRLARSVAQQLGKPLGRVLDILEFRQRGRWKDRHRQRSERITATVGRPHHRAADQSDLADHARDRQIGQKGCLHQRRLTGAACAEHQYERRAVLDPARQQFAQLVARPGTAEKYRRMLVFVRREPAIRRFWPADRHTLGQRAGAALQQRPQMLVQTLLELRSSGKAVRGSGIALAAIGSEPPPDEILHRRALRAGLVERGLVVKIGADPRGLAIEQEIRDVALAGARQRVLELPFRAGHRPPGDCAAEFILRQRHAEPRAMLVWL
jgi:hypothetical protein